ncbi:hypothetical protein BU15DRAFT_68607 [Melanogaster broomeanus]|nr:hypothetical protein BU15DRAFT_68607 [Melanogaster broomeanus]
MSDILTVAKFLLTGSALRKPVPFSGVYDGNAHSHSHQHSTGPPTAQPPPGSVVKQEYELWAHYRILQCWQINPWERWTDGRWIPRIPGCDGLKACVEQVEAEKRAAAAAAPPTTFTRETPPHMTVGILSLTYPDVEVELELEPSAFLNTIDGSETLTAPYVEDPEFQPYFAQAWATFQADRAGKDGQRGKRVRFDGVEIPVRTSTKLNPRAAMVSEELLSPQVQQARGNPQAGPSRPATPPAPAATAAHSVPAVPATPIVQGSTSNVPLKPNSANTPSASYPNQYRYSFPLEDEAAPKWVLDRVLETSIPVPVRDLISVSPDFRKHFREMTTTKQVTAVGVVHVNELSGRDPGSVSREYGDRILRNEDGLIRR